jgi:hypothetical protein
MFAQLVIREMEQASKDLKNLYQGVESVLVEAYQICKLVNQKEVRMWVTVRNTGPVKNPDMD